MAKNEISDDDKSEVRLDKWLWAARFYKTRALAHKAIEAGKVSIVGMTAKAGRDVKPGQEISIRTPNEEYCVIVEKLAAQRGPATVAVTLYRETEESIKRRDSAKEERKLLGSAMPNERPNSQDRKSIRRLKEG